MSPSAKSGPACVTGRSRALATGCMLAWVLAGASLEARAQSGASGETASKPHAVVVAHGSKPGAVHAPELSVASLGGGLQDAQQTALFTPLGKQSGVQVRLLAWDGTLATMQRRAETGAGSGSASWDLALMEDAPLRVACREGLFVPRPQSLDPADTAPDSSGRDCGVPAWRMNLVLAWDKSRVDMAPTWSDFWDVARRPGKRGLRRDPRGTLEIALMADGVAPEDVYRTLATSEGVDRAFRKLDQLKPYIVWWTTPAEAVQIIESGAVLMTSAPSGEIATADQAGHRNFGTQWAQSLGVTFDWAVPRATTPEQRALAKTALAFLADPARQAAFLASYEAAPVAGQVQAGSNPAATAGPGTPDHQRATLMMDDSFWADHLVTLNRRFNSWLEAK